MLINTKKVIGFEVPRNLTDRYVQKTVAKLKRTQTMPLKALRRTNTIAQPKPVVQPSFKEWMTRLMNEGAANPSAID